MTNEFLLSKLHVICLAVDRALKNTHLEMDLETYNELRGLQAELEKQAITGDSP